MRRETEIALTYGLTFADQVPRIPTIQVGAGAFDPAFAERYWLERLELDDKHTRKRHRRKRSLIPARLDGSDRDAVADPEALP